MRRQPKCRQLAPCSGKSRLGQEPVRTIRSPFGIGIRDLSLYPIDRRLQRWRRRPYSILPGWNRGKRIGHRQYTVYVPSGKAKQPPEVHPRAGQRHGTTCTAGSRKCSVRTRILLHRQGQGSSRSHSCSTDEPAFWLCGTGNRS